MNKTLDIWNIPIYAQCTVQERRVHMSAVTIFDVARLAGVSKSTVSLVLNNSPLVKDQTRVRVEQAIKALHYVPNNNARGLRPKATNCLGIVIMAEDAPDIRYDFDQHTGLCSYNISTGIMSALVDTDYGAIIERFCSVQNPGELPNIVQKKRVDGVFIVGSPYDKGMIERLKEIRMPFVVVGVDSYEEGVDSVRSDPGEGVEIGLRYLYDTGHKKICFINCPQTFHSARVREDALERITAELGISIPGDWLFSCDQNNGKSAYEKFKTFWEAGNRPDALLAANGYLAMGVMRYLYEQNVRMPDDISIMAYEDSSISGYATPALTTVNIHKEHMGEIAAHCLLRRMLHPDLAPGEYIVPADIVIRDSVRDRTRT